MSCNCKGDKLEGKIGTDNNNNTKINVVLNFLTFLLILPLMLLVVIPATVYIMFKSLVLKDNKVNVMSMLVKIGKNTLSKDDEDEFEDEFEDGDEFDYELDDFDYIENK